MHVRQLQLRIDMMQDAHLVGHCGWAMPHFKSGVPSPILGKLNNGHVPIIMVGYPSGLIHLNLPC
jgi:hypothetical protein